MKETNTVALCALIVVFVFAGNAHAEGVLGTTPTTDFSFTRNLTMGSRGNDVFVLQQFLIAGEFLTIATPTGYFGGGTKAAIILWQRAVGITPPSGFFGLLSRGKINTPVKTALATAVAVSHTIATTTLPQTNSGSPIRLKIPKLGIDAPFQYNGLSSLGIMEIPNNVTDAGWFTGAPRPGEKGVSIITGHVAQIRGGVVTKQGVFSRLNELVPNDTFTVLTDQGVSKTFVVRESRTYEPSVDTNAIFTANDDGSHLRLITCEGTWEADKQSFTKRLVVFADAIK